MKRNFLHCFNLLQLCCLWNHSLANVSAFHAAAAAEVLRVATVNVWNGGGHSPQGLAKLAQHIFHLDADIVALQEVYGDGAERIASFLNKLDSKVDASTGDHAHHKWTAVSRPCKLYTDTALLSRHKIVETTASAAAQPSSSSQQQQQQCGDHLWGNGARFHVPRGKDRLRHWAAVNVFSMHLDYKNYLADKLGKHPEIGWAQVLKAEQVRLKNIWQLLANQHFQQWNGTANSRTNSLAEPLLILGDFNTPSHLDWGEANKNAHNGRVIPWPSTKLLEDNGFVDAFRAVHPNATEEPGLSWPFDTAAASVVGGGIGERLDYVFYSGGGANSTSQQQLLMMRPVNAFLYPTRSASSGKFYYTQNGGVNIEWPSDHFAVVVDFEWRREHA